MESKLRRTVGLQPLRELAIRMIKMAKYTANWIIMLSRRFLKTPGRLLGCYEITLVRATMLAQIRKPSERAYMPAG